MSERVSLNENELYEILQMFRNASSEGEDERSPFVTANRKISKAFERGVGVSFYDYIRGKRFADGDQHTTQEGGTP